MGLKGYYRGVPIGPEASKAIKRKAKMGYGYKAKGYMDCKSICDLRV